MLMYIMQNTSMLIVPSFMIICIVCGIITKILDYRGKRKGQQQ